MAPRRKAITPPCCVSWAKSVAPSARCQIFTKSQNKIQEPARLYIFIELIDKENWHILGTDIKGEIYEGLLEKNAEDTKSGAGQYFTPRALIKVIVQCLAPEPMRTIADPAFGTGGFFLAAYDYLNANHKLDRDQKQFIKHNTFFGNEIVAGTRRLALMNLFLHNIGDIDSETFISPADALIGHIKAIRSASSMAKTQYIHPLVHPVRG